MSKSLSKRRSKCHKNQLNNENIKMEWKKNGGKKKKDKSKQEDKKKKNKIKIKIREKKKKSGLKNNLSTRW